MNHYYHIKITEPQTGRTVSIGPEEELRVVEDGLEGFGATEMMVESSAYADGTGGHPVTRRFGERYLSVTAELLGDSGTVRRKICGLMNPLMTLEMEVDLDGTVRCISVIPCGKPEFRQASFFTPVEVTLPFVAPDPFYREAGEKQVTFWQSLPMLTFPLNLMKGAGTIAGYYRTTDTAEIFNPGDASCGFTAVLTAAGGAVENPGIRMGDRYVRLTVTLQDGDTAEIDTRPRRKNVWINGVRQFTFQRDSDFFLLEPGNNRVQITADTGTEYLSARIRCTPLYYGI